jgi:hypothetical protein
MKATAKTTTRRLRRAMQSGAAPVDLAGDAALHSEAERAAAYRAAAREKHQRIAEQDELTRLMREADAHNRLKALSSRLIEAADTLGDIKGGLHALDMATDALGDFNEEAAFYFLVKALDLKVERTADLISRALDTLRDLAPPPEELAGPAGAR